MLIFFLIIGWTLISFSLPDFYLSYIWIHLEQYTPHQKLGSAALSSGETDRDLWERREKIAYVKEKAGGKFSE